MYPHKANRAVVVIAASPCCLQAWTWQLRHLEERERETSEPVFLRHSALSRPATATHVRAYRVDFVLRQRKYSNLYFLSRLWPCVCLYNRPLNFCVSSFLHFFLRAQQSLLQPRFIHTLDFTCTGFISAGTQEETKNRRNFLSRPAIHTDPCRDVSKFFFFFDFFEIAAQLQRIFVSHWSISPMRRKLFVIQIRGRGMTQGMLQNVDTKQISNICRETI